MKSCSKCGKVKLYAGFSKDRQKKDGLCSTCKDCQSTFVKRERRCNFCRGWYTQKTSRNIFCKTKCRRKHWARVWRLGHRGTLYNNILYHRQLNERFKKFCKDCGTRIYFTSLRCRSCNNKYRASKLVLDNHLTIVLQ